MTAQELFQVWIDGPLWFKAAGVMFAVSPFVAVCGLYTLVRDVLEDLVR